MFSSAEQVDLEKYSPVCVKPDDQSETASSDQVIVHQVIGEHEQPKKLKQAHLQAHLKGWVLNSHFELSIIIHRYSLMFFSIHQCGPYRATTVEYQETLKRHASDNLKTPRRHTRKTYPRDTRK